MSPLYLYCFALNCEWERLDICGLEKDKLISLIRLKELTAVVSEVDIKQFTGEKGDNNLSDINWIAPRAAAHQQVVDHIHSQSSVLPVRFGTIFSSSAPIIRFIEKQHDDIVQWLTQVRDKEEWAIQGFCLRREIVKDITAKSISSNAEKLEKISPGRRYFEEKKIANESERDLNSWLDSTRENLSESLSLPWMTKVERNIISKKSTGREEDMVLNWAFLLSNKKLADFKNLVTKLNREYEEKGVFFETTGPWPPYSFCPEFDLESLDVS